MARKGSKTITFDIVANGSQAEAELKKLDGDVEKLQKDGQFVYKVKLDGEKQLLQFDKLIGQYNKNGDNSLVVTLDQDALKASFGESENTVKAGMQELANILKQYLNLDGIFKNQFSGAGSKEIEAQLSSYTQKVLAAREKVNKEFEKSKTQLKDTYKEDLASAYEGNTTKAKAQYKQLYERMKQYRAEADINTNGVEGKNGKYNRNDLKKRYDEINEEFANASGKTLNTINMQTDNAIESINEKYRSVFNMVKTGYKEIQDLLSGGFVNESDLDSILSGQFDLKEIRKRANANKEAGYIQNTDGNLQNIKPTFDITSEQIDNIRSKLEAGLSNIEVKVHLDSSQVEKIRKSIQDADVSDYANTNSDIIDSYNKFKSKKDNTIREEIKSIFRKNENSRQLNSEDQRQLASLAVAFEGKGKKFNKKTLARSVGLDSVSDSFFGDFDNIKDEFSKYVNETEGGIKVNVTLEPKSVDGRSLQENVESQLNNITIKVGNVEGLESAVEKSSQDAFKSYFNQQEKKLQRALAREQEDNRKQEALKKSKEKQDKLVKNGIADAEQKVNEELKLNTGKENEIDIKFNFVPDLKEVKSGLKSIVDNLNMLSATDKSNDITLSVKLDPTSVTTAQTRLDEILKPDTKTIHIDFDNLNNASEQLANELNKAFNTLGINETKKVADKLPDKLDSDKLVKEEEKAAENINNTQPKIEVQTNAEEVEDEFQDVYEAMQKVFDASKSGNVDLFDESISQLEDLMDDKYAQLEDLGHSTDLINAFKDGDINAARSRLNEIYDIDMPWVERQTDEAVNVIETAKQKIQTEPIKVDVDTSQAENKYAKLLEDVKIIQEYQKFLNESGRFVTDGLMPSISDYGLTPTKYYKDSQISGNSTTSRSVKTALNAYKKHQNEKTKNTLYARVAAYNNFDGDLENIFANDKDILNNINSYIESAKKYKKVKEAYIDLMSELSSITEHTGLTDFDTEIKMSQTPSLAPWDYKGNAYIEEINSRFNLDIPTLSDSITSQLDKQSTQVDDLGQEIQAKHKEIYDKLQKYLSNNSDENYNALIEELTKSVFGEYGDYDDTDIDLMDQMVRVGGDYDSNTGKYGTDLTYLVSKILDPQIAPVQILTRTFDDKLKEAKQARKELEEKAKEVKLSVEEYKSIIEDISKIQELKADSDYSRRFDFTMPEYYGEELQLSDFYGKSSISGNSTTLKSIKSSLKAYKENKQTPKKYQRYGDNYNKLKLMANVFAYNGSEEDLNDVFVDDKELLEKIKKQKVVLEKCEEARSLTKDIMSKLGDVTGLGSASVTGKLLMEHEKFYTSKDFSGDEFIDSINEKLGTNIPKLEEAQKKIQEYNQKKKEAVQEMNEDSKSYTTHQSKHEDVDTVEEVKTETEKQGGFDVPINLKVTPSVEEVKSDINSIKRDEDVVIDVKAPKLDSLKADINEIKPSQAVNIDVNVNPEIQSIKSQIDSITGKDVDINLRLNDNKITSLNHIKEFDELVDEYIRTGQKYAVASKQEITGAGEYKLNDNGKLRAVASNKEAQIKAAKEYEQELGALKEKFFELQDAYTDVAIDMADAFLPSSDKFLDEIIGTDSIDVDKIKQEIRKAFNLKDLEDTGNVLPVVIDPGDSISNIQSQLIKIATNPIIIKFDASQSLKELSIQLSQIADKTTSSTELSSAIKQESQSSIKNYWNKYKGILARRNENGELSADLNKYLDEKDINKDGSSTNIKKLSGVITQLKGMQDYDEGYEDLVNRAVQLLSGVDKSDSKKVAALNKLESSDTTGTFAKIKDRMDEVYSDSIQQMMQLTPRSEDIINKAIMMSKKEINGDQKSQITESYLNALSTGGYKEAIESLNKSLNIKLPLDNLEKSVSTGLTTNLTAVSNIMSELTTSAIPSMSNAFAKAADDINTQTDRIKESISSISGTVKEITETLSSAGLTDVRHLEGYEKQLKQLEKERQAITKEREAAQAEISKNKEKASKILENVNVKAESIISKATDKANKVAQKAQEAADKQQQVLQKQQEKMQKQQEDVDIQNTQNVDFDRNKELLQKYANNTKGFKLDDSSVKKLSNGMIEFSGELETADGNIEKVTASYRALSDIATKSKTLNKGFLKDSIIPENIVEDIQDQVQSVQTAVETVSSDVTNAVEQKAEKQLSPFEKQVESIKTAAKETQNFYLDESSIKDLGNGFVEFQAEIRNADGSAKELLYTIKDIADFTTNKGSLNKSFINAGKDVTTTLDANISEQEEKLSEYEKVVDEIKKAGELTQNFEVLPDSFKLNDKGFVEFTAQVVNARGEVKEFLYTLSEVSNFTTGKGNFKSNFVSKGVDVELQKAKEEAIKEAKAYKESIEAIPEEDLTDMQMRAKIALIDVANVKNAKLDKEAPAEDKFLTESQVNEQKSLIKEILNEKKKFDEEFSDVEFGNISIDKSGAISILSTFKDIDGAVQSVVYKFEDLSELINEDTLDTSRQNFADAFIGTSDKLKNNTNIESLKNDIIQMEQAYAIYNATVNSDSTDQIEAKNKAAIEEEIEAINRLNQAMDEKNMSEKEKQSVYDDILEKSKIDPNKFVNLENASTSARGMYNKLRDDSAKLLDSIPDNSNLSEKFINKIISVDGIKQPLFTRIKELRNELQDGLFQLFNGDFADEKSLKAFGSHVADVKRQLKNIVTDSKNTTDNIFGAFFNPTGMTNGEITKFIKEQYAEKYGLGGLKVSDYDKQRGSVVEFNDNGTIQKVTVKIEKYVEAMNSAAAANEKAANSTSDAVNKMKQVGDAAEKASKKTKDGIQIPAIPGSEYSDEDQMAVIKEMSHRTNVRKYQTAGQNWVQGVKAKIGNLTQYVTGIDIVMRAWNEIQQGFIFVKEFNSALTTINQTMSTTQEQLAALGQGSIDTGKQLGASAQDVLDAAAIYANANETSESILQKAKPTVLLANASGADTSTSADQIQGVIEQFKELEGQETRVVNSYEKISSGLAIDFAKGINIMSEGVQTAGSVAEQAGLKFETFAASVGKISEKTRQEGSQIGNAYKTILARISRSKSADEDVSDEDRSNAAKALASVDISTYDNQGNFKDLDDILDELSEKWQSLTDAQRNYMICYIISKSFDMNDITRVLYW